MLSCKDCHFYKKINSEIGTCYGRRVPANRDAEECPMKAFKPKDPTKTK